MKPVSRLQGTAAPDADADAPSPRPVTTVAAALWGEFEAIHGEARPPGLSPEDLLTAYRDAADGKAQAALCLSGGGIRSASFSLGVLQALAETGLLKRFHYLSTVSGGGYIGGWLQAFLMGHGGDAAAVEKALAGRVAPEQIRALRGYTSYLAPGASLFSPDVWAAVALWVRNVLINWMVFLPALLALAVMPLCYAALIAGEPPVWAGRVLLLLALGGLGVAVYNGAWELPSHVPPDRRRTSADETQVAFTVIVPMMLWVALVPVVAGPWLRPVMPLGALSGDAIPPLSFLVTLLAGLAAGLRTGLRGPLFWRSLNAWAIASAVSAGVLWVLLTLGIGLPAGVIAVLGPLAVASAHLVLTLVFVALRREAKRGDLDREWLGRLSGIKIVPPAIWALFAAICLLLPPLVAMALQVGIGQTAMAIAAAAGPAAAYLGKISRAMPGSGPGKLGLTVAPVAVIAEIAALVFGIFLFTLLAMLAMAIAGDGFWPRLVLLVVCVGIALALGHRINVNRFSMHAVYRSRLVRGFLGTVRKARTPDRFTGIDPMDNPRMQWLTGPAGAQRLFPVINITLNLVSGKNAAWKERKAESFTVTPLTSGGANLHRIEDSRAGKPRRGAYARSAGFAGDEPRDGGHDPSAMGISLGTAITLSGAAVSPNMGYNSSPATAFLMTLFNVRLGAWLPNPAVASAEALKRTKPPNAVLSLGRELLGLTNDQGRDVYLSDGGHFENLGIYEMIRRRCRHILVIDAGHDPKAHFEDLGNAVRKVRIDFDTEIQFAPPVGIGSRETPKNPFTDVAFATIRYPEDAAPTGRLIYIKPSYPPDKCIDIQAYGAAHAAFPHEPTLDQFFTESQFESYRRLGQEETRALVGDRTTLEALFAAPGKAGDGKTGNGKTVA